MAHIRLMPSPRLPSLVSGLLLLLAVMPAAAHGPATGLAAPSGTILIPNLSHGQMRAIAAYRPAVMDLAAAQIPTDPAMRRLEGFINLQRFACLWGLVPGSVTDEDSPFNECAHAYLAATRALLLHLQAMPGNMADKRLLAQTIDRAMLDDGASLILCRYSDEPFNTAALVVPQWSAIPRHAHSALAFTGAAVPVLGLVVLTLRRKRD